MGLHLEGHKDVVTNFLKHLARCRHSGGCECLSPLGPPQKGEGLSWDYKLDLALR